MTKAVSTENSPLIFRKTDAFGYTHNNVIAGVGKLPVMRQVPTLQEFL